MRLAASLLALFLLLASAVAQPSDSAATIVGRIFNPASGEYVRNAQVRIEGHAQSTVSEDGGYYRLTGVSPGEVTVVVDYTGYRSASATLIVTPGSTATRDFQLTSGLAIPDDGSPIELNAFTVSSEREGNAKAIMQQRNSMNITNSVASDVFGDVAEGNVGEFLKHLPGVELDLAQGEIRTVRLRGLGSEYTQVTMDGVSLASADANQGASGNARAFSFEQVSLSSMESIEISKTISADVDANAPAGTINLRSKRAFDREGRRVSAQANLTAHSSEFHLDRTHGPDDSRSRKIYPGGIFEYSDVFFNNRLGLILNVSESMLYSANARTTVTYNYTPTAADPRPVVPTQLQFLHAPRTNRRSTVTLNGDLKATERLVLSLSLVYNYAALNNPQRTVTFNAGARNTVSGDDPLTAFTTTSPSTFVTANPAAIVKLGQTISAIPRFEYKIGNFTLEGRFAASDSTSWYDPPREGSIRDAGNPRLNGPTFRATRTSVESADWQVVQVAGPSLDDGANFTMQPLQVSDGRYGRTRVYSGELVGILRTEKWIPIVWKAGLKRRFETRDFRNETESMRYTYVGPGAMPVGTWADYRSPFEFDINANGSNASIHSASGGSIWLPDILRLGELYRENPDQFTRTMTATNYYNAFVANRRYYEEEIDAAFVMGTASFNKLSIRAGLRREETSTDAEEFDPRTPEELAAAGFAEANGIASTIPGLEYQYFSKSKIHRTGTYSNLFPSGSLKYRFNRNLDLHLGFSSTIRRPTFRDLAGVWIINDENLTVSAPNPSLKPERSKNFSARLAYYFEPVGIFAINAFQNNVRGLFISNRLTAEEFGYSGDEDLSAYEFITTTSSEEEVTVRGMEYEYSQSLSFLPHPFSGLNVRASYTRNYAQIKVANMIPHSINAGLSYTYGRFSGYANMNWRDAYPTTVSGTPRFYRHRTNLDIGGNFRLTNRVSMFFSARNLFNEPYIILEQMGDNPAVGQMYESNGTNWTFGIKSVW